MKKGYIAFLVIMSGMFTFFNPLKVGFDINYTTVINFIMLSGFFTLFHIKRESISVTKLSGAERFFAIVLGVCMTLGYGLMRKDGFDVFYASALSVTFTIAALVFYCRFAVFLTKFLFNKTDVWLEKQASVCVAGKNRFINFMYRNIEQNHFKFYFMVFLIAWLVPFLINLPGIVMFDTRNQVEMYYHIPNHHTNASVLLDNSQYITQHHSVPHTLLIGLLFDLSKALFGSFEPGIFMYAAVQYVIMAAIVAYMFKSIKQYIGTKWTFLGVSLFGLHSFFPISAILVTKDIYFCGMFVLYMLKYYELLRQPDKFKEKRFFTEFLLITLALILLRNNALYSLAFTSLILLFVIKKKRYLVSYTALFLAFNIVYTNVLLPAFNISPGSPRELLSVPFQQTAYYINEYPDEVTDEEKAAISKVIDYEIARTQYNPELSDAVKDSYNKYATSEDLRNYLITWGKMFLKHPLSYVEAFISQNYGYYYPGVKRSLNYHCYNDYSAKNAMVKDGVRYLSPAKPGVLQIGYFLLQNAAYYAPFVCLLTDTGIYLWLWIFMILFIVRNFSRKKQYILYYIPYAAYLLFILAGPANGTVYVRYIMPFIYTLPLMLLPVFEYKREKLTSEQAQISQDEIKLTV